METTQYVYEVRVDGEGWRTDTECRAEDDIMALMMEYSITSLRCDTLVGLLEVRATEA